MEFSCWTKDDRELNASGDRDVQLRRTRGRCTYEFVRARNGAVDEDGCALGRDGGNDGSDLPGVVFTDDVGSGAGNTCWHRDVAVVFANIREVTVVVFRFVCGDDPTSA